MDAKTTSRLKLIAIEAERNESDFGQAVRAGLGTTPKWLPCRFFYDAEGSRIFEAICELPEYYPTRAEHEILTAQAAAIASEFGRRTSLVELGSGSSTKTRTLIEAFLVRHGALRYVPVDISRSILEESSRALLAEYPGLEILAIAAEYRHGLHRLRSEEDVERKLILWLGSSIGNFGRREAARFLTGVAAEMAPRDRLLVGIDLRKNPDVLVRAYDDAAGVTAHFNKNILVRANRELGATFDLASFRHEARWQELEGRIEMHLVSTIAQTVAIPSLDLEVSFKAGESIHTENSHKYSHHEIRSLAVHAGLTVEKQWSDRAGRFSLNLLAPQCSS